MAATKQTSKKMIAKVKIMQKQAGIADEDYRMLLEDRYGVDSCTQLNSGQLGNLIEHLGKTLAALRGQPAQAQRADDPQSKMIRGVWLELHELGAVRDPSEKALGAFVRRQCGIEHLTWLTTPQASAVIESLKKWRDRVNKGATDE